MSIEWNKVTWYSKILAVVLFVAVFWIGFHLGSFSKSTDKVTPKETATVPTEQEKKTTPAVSISTKNIKEENFTAKVAVITGTSSIGKKSQTY